MGRLIDADAMLEYLNLMYDEQHSWRSDYNTGVLGAINYIKHKAPTIDAVEVVRCKDCKYFEFDSWAKVNEIPIIVAHEICKFWGSGCGCKTDSDGYCSFGERKETDHE